MIGPPEGASRPESEKEGMVEQRKQSAISYSYSWEHLVSLSMAIVVQLAVVLAWIILRYFSGANDQNSSIPILGFVFTLILHICCACLFALDIRLLRVHPKWWKHCLSIATSLTFVLGSAFLALSRADLQHWLHYEIDWLPEFFQGASIACEEAGALFGEEAEDLCLVGQSQMTHGLALFWSIFFVLFVISSKFMLIPVTAGAIVYVSLSIVGASSIHLPQSQETGTLFLYADLLWWVLSLAAMTIARLSLDRTKVLLHNELQSKTNALEELDEMAAGLNKVARHLCDVVLRLDVSLRAFEVDMTLHDFFKRDVQGTNLTDFVAGKDQERFLSVFRQVSGMPGIPGCITVTLQLDSGPCEASLLIAAVGAAVPSYIVGIRVEGFRLPPPVADSMTTLSSAAAYTSMVAANEIQHCSISEYSPPSLQPRQAVNSDYGTTIALNLEVHSMKLIECSDRFAKLIGHCPPGTDSSSILHFTDENEQFYKGLQDHGNSLYWAESTATGGSTQSSMSYKVSVVLHSKKGVRYKARCCTTLKRTFAARDDGGVDGSGEGVVAHVVLTDVQACVIESL